MYTKDVKECLRLIKACIKHLEAEPHNKRAMSLLKQVERKLNIIEGSIRRE